ncbi:MAG: phytanoyl-CoA dioxygenase family protein [Bacteroidota bacterium]
MSMPTHELLRSAAANRDLHQRGFAVMPYLEAEALEQLQALFNAVVPQPVSRFYASTHSPDLAFRQRVNDAIAPILAPAHQQHLHRGQALGAALIAKPPGPAGILPLHQDWNIVNEGQARSFNIWIPLVDVDDHNGAVAVLPGSHRLFSNHRGPDIPSALAGYEARLQPRMHTVSMRAGEALIYDHALWHRSAANESERLRPAVVLGLIPDGTALQFCFGAGEHIETYAGYPEYFFRQNLGEKPHDRPRLAELPMPDYPLSESEFLRLFPEKREIGFLRWWNKLVR